MKSSSPDFNRLCNDVLEIQRLTRGGSKACNSDKNVHLSYVEGEGSFKRKCGNCRKVCRFKAKNARRVKGICMVVAWTATEEAVQTMVAPVRHVISVVRKGIKKQDAPRNFLRRHRHGPKKECKD